MKTLSISDDDLCATCKFCQYDPGKESTCDFNFYPAIANHYDDIRICEQYQQIDYPEQNWNLTP